MENLWSSWYGNKYKHALLRKVISKRQNWYITFIGRPMWHLSTLYVSILFKLVISSSLRTFDVSLAKWHNTTKIPFSQNVHGVIISPFVQYKQRDISIIFLHRHGGWILKINIRPGWRWVESSAPNQIWPQSTIHTDGEDSDVKAFGNYFINNKSSLFSQESSLLSSVGGAMSLYLGISLVMVAELLEYLVLLGWTLGRYCLGKYPPRISPG